MTRFLFSFGLLLCLGSVRAGEKSDSVWNLEKLSAPPAFRWVDEKSPIRELIYTGEKAGDCDTEVFAFYASPKTIGVKEFGDGPFPAVVLIHGGGGTAFSEWVWLWAKRGYAAISMDLSGHRPPSPEYDPATGEFKKDRGYEKGGRTRLEKGGLDQSHAEKFDSIGGAVDDDWPRQAVADAILAHSLIRSFPEVDPDRTAVTGISWGGYTTCLVASVDSRFKAAAPVYGCGFLHEGESVQKPAIDRLEPPERRAEWIRRYDPSSHLAQCRVPILFVNGSHDIHYPLDSCMKSYALVPGEKKIRIQPKMGHSHPAGWAPVEIGLFFDTYCRDGVPLMTLGRPQAGPRGSVTVACKSEVPLKKAVLHFTTETGTRSERKWEQRDAMIGDDAILAPPLPPEANTWFLTVEDERGAMLSTEVIFFDQEK